MSVTANVEVLFVICILIGKCRFDPGGSEIDDSYYISKMHTLVRDTLKYLLNTEVKIYFITNLRVAEYIQRDQSIAT